MIFNTCNKGTRYIYTHTRTHTHTFTEGGEIENRRFRSQRVTISLYFELFWGVIGLKESLRVRTEIVLSININRVSFGKLFGENG